MNERIKELAEKFNLEIDPAHPNHNQKVLENLAELIVRECIDVVQRTVDGKPVDDLKEHFGVE